ncbi:uncharacterized protein METZ01_LOCUS286244, partial [marine metagenome]
MSEEIPARLQLRGAGDLKSLVCTKLSEQDLSFSAAVAHVAPRRLVLVVDGLAKQQPDRTEERKGPRTNAADKAIAGFLQSVGCDSVDHPDIQKRKIKGTEFYFVKRSIAGQSTRDILSKLILDAILEFRWPKSMRWDLGHLRWVRPIRSILCLFDGHPVEGGLSIDAESDGNVKKIISFSNKTSGHRFLAPDPFTVKAFDDYQKKMRSAFVMINSEERRRLIAQKTELLAKDLGLSSGANEQLLEENAGLVEWPIVLVGSFEKVFLSLPNEVLVTSMQRHQKYFPLYEQNGSLAPRFVMVANLKTDDDGAAIVAGNERVLRARLFDAKF